MVASGMRGLTEAMRNLAVKPTGRTMTTTASRAPLISHIPLTIHAFPTLEPLSLESWSAKYLYIPLRRDILHRAVTYEADNARQGTASTKTRWDVRGSHRKVRPQKGTGHARAGTRQSPIFRGGGTVFGPHPRDFGTWLTRKAYDLAWRMALSYRYRRGELVVCQDGMEMRVPEDFSALRTTGFMEPELVDGYLRKQVVQLVEAHGWGLKKGRTLFVTDGIKETLFEAVEKAGDYAEALEVEDIDVKDLLAGGRLVIEREALRWLIEEHSSDLESRIFINGQKATGPPLCKTIVA